jgi:LuxR family transcriptional regulator, maltose regulon positive regulatory protein
MVRHVPSAELMLERYKVLGGALALREFSVSELAELSGVGEPTVRTILRRESNFFEQHGRKSTGRRGGQPVRWRLRSETRESLRAQLAELERLGVGPWFGERLEGDNALSAGIVMAEDVLLRLAPTAISSLERAELVKLAQAQLDAADASASANTEAQWGIADRRYDYRRRIVELLLNLEHADQDTRARCDQILREAHAQAEQIVSEARSKAEALEAGLQKRYRLVMDEISTAQRDIAALIRQRDELADQVHVLDMQTQQKVTAASRTAGTSTRVSSSGPSAGDYGWTPGLGSHREVEQITGSALVVSKLRHPSVRSKTVRRSSLIERLRRSTSGPVVSVVAPAGYGKTTLLAQWAERNDQAVAWVSVDEADNDPKVLLTYLAEALNAVEPVGGEVFDALASPASSVPGSVVPRLGSAFWSMTTPVALVLDDAHLLHNTECRSVLSMLADHVPGGSRLVLAGRDEPPLQTARLRAEGRLTEIGPGDLALSRAEAAALLSAAGVTLSEDELAVLQERTEGWPAGLYLAALHLRERDSLGSAAVSFGGDDRLVSEYVESEILAGISARDRVFLTRTSVLERMCGPLCEAVLELPGSAAVLAELAQSNLLLVQLDRRGQWYRYHHLFRDVLLAELERTEPGLVPVLRRRAAGWCLANGRPEEALEYSMAAGDVDTAGRLVEKLVLPTFQQARVATLQRWFRWLDAQDGIERQPMLALLAGIVFALAGRAAEAERWADAVDRWQYGDAPGPADPSAEAWAAVLRALLCRRGVGQMRADADEAARKSAAGGIAAPPLAIVMQGVARVLSGDLDDGDTFFKDAISSGQEVAWPDAVAVALCERSLVAMARGEWIQAETLGGQAPTVLRQAGMETSFVTSVLCAVQARLALHRGDAAAARQELVTAQRTSHLLTYAQPHLAVQARIELIRVHLALGDAAAARTLMREIDDVLKKRPGLGTLVGEAQALRARLSEERTPSVVGASALTAAELRVLRLLATHLTLPEIGAELFLSPNTVKSQTMSLYRKLGVSSRAQAAARSRELGLLPD